MSYIGNEPIVSATRTVTEITATAGQTVFTANGGYTVGYIDVFVNGSQLQNTDFTATNGSTITLNEATQVNDVVRLVAWGTFSSANITSGSLSAGGITWSQAGGVTLPRIDSTNEGGQLNFNRASDNTVTWSIDSFGNTSTPSLRFIDGANVRMAIDGSGNIGIGTSSPTGRIAIDATNSNTPRIVFKNPSANGDGAISTFVSSTGTDVILGSNAYINSAGNFARFDSAQAGSYVYANRSGLLLFGTNDTSGVATERMRIGASGNVVVGTTAQVGSEILGALQTANNQCFAIQASNASYTNDAQIIYANRNTTNNSFYYFSCYNIGATAYRFRIADSGNATNTNGSYGTISDVKLKENIVDATPKLDKVNQLKVRNYNFIGDDLKQIGFVAQEFEQVFPSMVEETADKDADGNDLGTTTKTIKTTVLIPILVKAIQELKTIVDNQKIELDNAKAEIELLKGAN